MQNGTTTHEIIDPEFDDLPDNLPATRQIEQRAELPAIRQYSEPAVSEQNPHYGIATVELTDEQRAGLIEPLGDDALEILPTGEVYPPQVQMRKRLNQVVGPGRWALLPRSGYVQEGNTLVRQYALVINGRFVAEACGEMDYQPDNARSSKATTMEGVKSNALVRCCKDLGIGSECWDKRFCDQWRRKYAVKVWRKPPNNKKGPQWRRADAEPFFDEESIVGQRPAPQGTPPPHERQQQTPAAPTTQAAPPPNEVSKVIDKITRMDGPKKSRNGGDYYNIETERGMEISVFAPKLITEAQEILRLKCDAQMVFEIIKLPTITFNRLKDIGPPPAGASDDCPI